MNLAGLRCRYLIGKDNDDGQDGAFTVVGYDATQPPSKGFGGKYINLFDEKNSGTYGPYLTTSDTAQQYSEGQCDPAGAGFWQNLTDQLNRAKSEGFIVLGDLDNRDAYSNAVILKAYDQAQAAGFSVIAKNAGMSDLNEDSTVLLKHPAVIGCIIEKGDVTPAMIVVMRTAAGQPELPVWFVSFGDGRVWAEQIAAQIKAAHYVNVGVTYSADGEYGSSEDILVPLAAADHPAIAALPRAGQLMTIVSGFPYGQTIKNVMLARGYPWFPDQNVVTIETMNPDGRLCTTGANTFDDIKMVLDGAGNVIGGPWDATDHPGYYWTQHPMASGGAFIIALGPQACWTPGPYNGVEVWRQAPDSTIMGHRDPNDTYKRQGPPIAHGDIGVHHHHGYNLPKANISNAAAGCQVIRLNSEQEDFMALTKKCPRYLADPTGYRLTATVLEAQDIMAVTPPVPVPVPLPPVSTKSNFANCLALSLVFEGGNDDDPRDPGGRTSRGILQREWNTWRTTHPGLPSDVWQAPDDQVAAIYKQEYWDVMHCDAMPLGIDYAVFDFGVNSGPSRSVKYLQGILGVTADGIAGNATIAAAVKADPKATVNALCDKRLAFLKGLSTWSTFGRGWTNRVVGVRKDSLAMIGAPAVVVVPLPPAPPMKETGTMTFTINWKTTLAGMTAVFVAVGHMMSLISAGDWNWGSLVTDGQAIIVGIGLIFAKDGNVTGGTVAATPEAASRVQ